MRQRAPSRRPAPYRRAPTISSTLHRGMPRVLGSSARMHLLIVALLLAPTSRSLEKAKQAYEELDYEKVTPLLRRALKETDEPSELVQIWELMATLDVMYNNDAAAERDFAEILAILPAYQLPP